MATAETMTFTDNIKSQVDSIVKMTVLEAKALGDYLETVHGIKGAWIAEESVVVENDQVTEFRVTMRVSFVLD